MLNLARWLYNYFRAWFRSRHFLYKDGFDNVMAVISADMFQSDEELNLEIN